MSINRRQAIVTLGSAAIATGAMAQNYPERPIQLVMPGAAGGAPDIIARYIAPMLQQSLGQPVVVVNVPGASSIIGTDKVAKAAPDGYTLLYAFNQVAVFNPALHPKLPYQPQRDLAPISLTLDLGYVWIARPNFEVSTMAEFLQLARSRPGHISYASTGAGAAAHMGAVLLEKMAGIKMLHVPYKGSSGANSDLLAGVVDSRLEVIAGAMELVKTGKVKVLAVSTLKRHPLLPDVPTVSELVPGYEVSGWQGVWAPAGTPTPIIQRLNAALNEIVAKPEVKQRIAAMGYEAAGSTSQAMADRIARESASWGALIKSEGIKVE